MEQKVYYSDTDAYGVVWHGSYLRWLEMGRVEWCEMRGHDLIALESQNIVLPVTNINVRYKSSARLNDELLIETSVNKVSSFSVTFGQKIINKKTQKVFVEALVDVVAIDNNGKLYRRMPQILQETFAVALKEEMEQNAKNYATK